MLFGKYTVLLTLMLTICVFANDKEPLLQNIRQLTYQGKRAGEGYFSKDGKALVFQSEREKENPFFQIYTLNLETGDSSRVSPGWGKTTCAFFHPAGDKVLYASTHLDPKAKEKQKQEMAFRTSGKKRRYSWDYDKTMDIFTTTLDTSTIIQLTNTLGYDAEGSFSPDGSKIAFCSTRIAYDSKSPLSPEEQKRLKVDPAYFGEIYIMDADGSNQKRLTNWPGYDGGPFFSSDGTRIIWRHFEVNGMVADIYTMKLDGSDIKRLTNFKCMSWAPYFHPSGKYAIFAANKYGFSNFELFLVDANGEKNPIRVTHTAGFDGLPVFSPSGNQLCWTSNRTINKSSQLFMASWNHKGALQTLQMAPRQKNISTKKSNAKITKSDLLQHIASLKSAQKTEYIAKYLHRHSIQIQWQQNDAHIAFLSPVNSQEYIALSAKSNAEISVVLEIMAVLANNKSNFRRGVIFTLGTKSNLIKHFPVDVSKIVAFIDIGNIGQFSKNQLTITGVGTSSVWRKIIEKRNIPIGFHLLLKDSPPFSLLSLYMKRVPVLSIAAQGNSSRENYQEIERIAKFTTMLVKDLLQNSQSPNYIKIKNKRPGTASAKIYLGTIPDYLSSGMGVKLKGVRKSSPAAKAGLQAGDILIEFAGKKIGNIHEYAQVLGIIKVGVPVTLTIQRGKERKKLTITPGTRK